MSTPEPIKSGGLDLVGIGKVAHAIPPKVYERTVATALKTFEELVAPLTQTTDGVGRLIRQSFDNWVEERKAIAVYTIEQAVLRAKAKGLALSPPVHPKTFLRILEESSLETDKVLHEMWINLLTNEMTSHGSHPRFLNILTQLGPEEAKLLSSLKHRPRVGLGSFSGTGGADSGAGWKWVTEVGQTERPWNISLTILCQQNLAAICPTFPEAKYLRPADSVLLYLTPFGQEFLAVVALQSL